MEVTRELIVSILQTAVMAGEAIMDVYREPFDVELKPDSSPLTIADKKSHEIISGRLAQTGLPVLSEEGSQISYETRKDWKAYWLVDPLDGTKEFIKRNGDFTVNIALIKENKPVFGVVYAPVPGYLYWGSETGSFRMDVNMKEEFRFEDFPDFQIYAQKLPCVERRKGFLVLGSRSHMNSETESFIQNLHVVYPDLAFISRGSSLKFCTLAEGGADVYPRFGPTMEWDTAAGHAVAAFAGCSVIQAANGLPLLYNKPSLLNPYFIAERKKNEVTFQ